MYGFVSGGDRCFPVSGQHQLECRCRGGQTVCHCTHWVQQQQRRVCGSLFSAKRERRPCRRAAGWGLLLHLCPHRKRCCRGADHLFERAGGLTAGIPGVCRCGGPQPDQPGQTAADEPGQIRHGYFEPAQMVRGLVQLHQLHQLVYECFRAGKLSALGGGLPLQPGVHRAVRHVAVFRFRHRQRHYRRGGSGLQLSGLSAHDTRREF